MAKRWIVVVVFVVVVLVLAAWLGWYLALGSNQKVYLPTIKLGNVVLNKTGLNTITDTSQGSPPADTFRITKRFTGDSFGPGYFKVSDTKSFLSLWSTLDQVKVEVGEEISIVLSGETLGGKLWSYPMKLVKDNKGNYHVSVYKGDSINLNTPELQAQTLSDKELSMWLEQRKGKIVFVRLPLKSATMSASVNTNCNQNLGVSLETQKIEPLGCDPSITSLVVYENI